MPIPRMSPVAFALFLLACCPARAAIRYVDARTVPDIADGQSWQTAFLSVGQAMEFAGAGDEIWVAAGEHYGWLHKNGVAVYGGFAGTETIRTQRDYVRNVTLVNGPINVDQGPSTASAVDGFTIQNGDVGIGGYNVIIRNNIIRNNPWLGVSVNGTCSVQNNVITGNGQGGVSIHGGTVTVSNNRIQANLGTGVMVNTTQATTTIANNIILGNSGGGIHCGGINCVTRVYNNVIAANALNMGGAGIMTFQASATIIGNTIVANTSYAPGGAVDLFADSRSTLANNIIAFNTGGVINERAASYTLRNNNVFGNTGFNYKDLDDPTGTDGNISADPRLVNVPYGDFHIQPDSPCRDPETGGVAPSGWPDRDGQARIQGATMDIGADESDGTEWPTVNPAFYVGPAGDDANDGKTWATAKKTVQAALDAGMQQGGADVNVAAGVYPERIVSTDFLYLRGGYEGMDGGGRDPKAHPTVLDGGGGGTVVRLLGGSSYAVLDGFTVRNGVGSVLVGYPGKVAGGVFCAGLSGAITNNAILNNTAPSGGGMFVLFGSPRIANNAIRGNGAGGNGGGLVLDGALADVRNNVIAENVATGFGGGVYFSNSTGWTMTNNTIANNHAIEGGGLAGFGYSNPTLVNNIVALNSSGIYRNKAGTGSGIAFRNNLFWGNTGYDFKAMPDPSGENGNIRLSPRFANAALGNFHIQPDSPARDTGDGTAATTGDVDMDGQPRVQGSEVDMGADESDGTAWTVTPHTVRVAPDGSDVNDGASWETPMATVGAAIRAATTGGEVWVKAGTYTENLTLPAYVSLYGGFAGGETVREARNPSAHVTTLNGGAAGSVITAPVGTVNAKVDGFTVTNGRTKGNGGGLWASHASVAVANNRITGNIASSTGGGIGSERSFLDITGNEITSNTASSGGGIGVMSSTTVNIVGNDIRANRGVGRGGGVYTSTSTALVQANRLIGNTAGSEAGGVGSYGGVATLVSNLISGNRTTSTTSASVGGGFLTDGAATLLNNTISDNTSVGGSVYIKSAANTTVTLANNIIAFNSKGILRASSPPATSKLIFVANDIFGNTGYDVAGLADPTGTAGNVKADPLFVDRTAGNYRLQAASFAIDGGDDRQVSGNHTDVEGQPRIQGLHVDLGAYEAAGTVGFRWWDVAHALRVAGGLEAANGTSLERLDLGADGRLTMEDAARVARKAAGLDN